MAWDLNLCMTWDRKVLIPFHYFIGKQSQLSQTPSFQPFRFLDFPTDLQLIVYEQCDLPTLFQLMRTCQRTRGPAAKLFWANKSETHWYHSSDCGPYEYGPRRHPIIEHCQEFARGITQLELNLTRVELCFADDGGISRSRKGASTVEKANYFWKKLGEVFPSLTRVVLTGMVPRQPLPPSSGEFDEDYTAIETAVKCAPPDMVVQVAFQDDTIGKPRPRPHTLWQVATVPESTWQIVDENWNPTRILLPPRKFSGSPLGDIMTFTRRNANSMLEERGLDWLKIETYARYALDGVIHCPRLDCDGTFTERSQWKQHLHDSEHWRLGPKYGYIEDSTMHLWCWKGTPKTVQAAMEARQQRITAGYRQTKTLQRRVGCGWGEEGTVQRQLFEEQFFAQLREENFAMPGELLMEGWTCDWINCLHMYFDPTHVYYAGE
jgi:hypothetical protein